MKKIVSALLLFVVLFSTTASAFANQSEQITFKEMTEIAQKYGISLEIIEGFEPENIATILTKEEFESTILQMRTELSIPISIQDDLTTEEFFLPTSEDYSNSIISPQYTGWSTYNRVKSLSRTSEHPLSADFKLQYSVSAGYQFEARRVPGEPSETRNWKFTDVSDGGVVHLNPGSYEIKSISSSATLLSSTTIEQVYNGVVNVGFYTNVSGITVRVPIGDKDFSGLVRYSISEVK